MTFKLEISFPFGLGGKKIFKVILFMSLLTRFLHPNGGEREEEREGGGINGDFCPFPHFFSLQRALKALCRIPWIEKTCLTAKCMGVLGFVFFFPKAGRCILYGDPRGWGRNTLYCGTHSEGNRGRAVQYFQTPTRTHAQNRIYADRMQEWIWLKLRNRA